MQRRRRSSSAAPGLYFRAALADLELPPAAAPGAASAGSAAYDAPRRRGRARARSPSATPPRRRASTRTTASGVVRALELAEAGARSRRPTTGSGPRTRGTRRSSSRSTSRSTSSTRGSRRGRGRWPTREPWRRRSAPGQQPLSATARQGARARGVRNAARRRGDRRGRAGDAAARALPAQVAAPACRASLRSTRTGPRRRSPMRSSRWDAQGNIYLVTDGAADRRSACAREVGDADGILEVLERGDDWVEIAIWNPDGSRAEMSGNGTRIAARWLAERTGADDGAGPRRAARGARAHARRTASSSRTWGGSSVGEPEEVAGIRLHRRSTSATRTPSSTGDPARPAAHRAAARDARALPAAHERAGRPPRRPGRSRRASGSAARGRPASSGRAPSRSPPRFGGERGRRRFPRRRRSTCGFEGGRAFLTGPAEPAGTRPSSRADAVLAQRVVQRRLQVGRLAAAGR